LNSRAKFMNDFCQFFDIYIFLILSIYRRCKRTGVRVIAHHIDEYDVMDVQISLALISTTSNENVITYYGYRVAKKKEPFMVLREWVDGYNAHQVMVCFNIWIIE